MAVAHRQTECTSLFSDANASIHTGNNDGDDAVKVAAAVGHTEGVRLLLN